VNLGTNVPLVDIRAQHAAIQDEIEERVLSVLRSGGYVGGSEVEAFEREFAGYCEVSHALTFNSGTAALHAALLALGVGAGDEVITVSHTFVATAEAIVQAGARPVFVDIDQATYNLNPALLSAAITERTRAIIPVHLYGQPAAMDNICAIARARGIPVIEDACQAHGARYRGMRTGSFGAIACFSFYPSKNLGSAGEGGAAVTSSPALAERMRLVRDHGQRERYQHAIVGYNYRLPAIQAAILRVKLPHLEAWNVRRRELARLYNASLAGLDLVLPVEADDREHVYHLYVVRSAQRDAIAAHLASNGIATGIHYPKPVHLQPPYFEFGGGPGSLAVTERAATEVLSLPLYPELETAQVEAIANAVADFYRKGTGSAK